MGSNLKYMNLKKRIKDAVAEYIAAEDQFTDNVQLAVNPSDFSVEIADSDDDLPEIDYYPMMDLVRMNPENPACWIPDEEAIDSVCAEYAAD